PLRALGVTRHQRSVLGLARIGLAGAVGAGLAGVGAVLASPISPVGVARDLEPDPGIRVEWGILVLGSVLVLTLVVMAAVGPAVRTARFHRVAAGRGAASAWAASAGLPATVVAGTRFALDPGPKGVPTRSTLVGAATSVVLVVATLTFATSLDHFIRSPELYGTPWDAMITASTFDGSDLERNDIERLLGDVGAVDEVVAYGLLTPGQGVLDGGPPPPIAIEASPRPIVPVMVDGRAPTAPDEVALGSGTLERLDVEVG